MSSSPRPSNNPSNNIIDLPPEDNNISRNEESSQSLKPDDSSDSDSEITVSGPIDPGLDRVAEDMKTKKCCNANCLSHLDPFVVYQHQLGMQKMERRYKTSFLHGQIYSLASTLPPEEKGRKGKHISHFYFQGKKICMYAWIYVFAVNHKTYTRLMGHVKKKGLEPVEHGNKGRGRHLPEDSSSKVAAFLQNKADTIGIKVVPPAKSDTTVTTTASTTNEDVPSTSNTEEVPNNSKPEKKKAKKTEEKPKPILPLIYLPSVTTKKSLYKEYESTLPEGIRPVSIGSFWNIWKKVLPNMRIRKQKAAAKSSRTSTPSTAQSTPPPLLPLHHLPEPPEPSSPKQRAQSQSPTHSELEFSQPQFPQQEEIYYVQ